MHTPVALLHVLLPQQSASRRIKAVTLASARNLPSSDEVMFDPGHTGTHMYVSPGVLKHNGPRRLAYARMKQMHQGRYCIQHLQGAQNSKQAASDSTAQ